MNHKSETCRASKLKIADIAPAQGKILLLGCGGGFDAGSALPIFSALKDAIGPERIILGGVQEPAISNFDNYKRLANAQNIPAQTMMILTEHSEIVAGAEQHPILSVRKCPELCLAKALQIEVLYVSASTDLSRASSELADFCLRNQISRILGIDTGIDSHLPKEIDCTYQDAQIDNWSIDLLKKINAQAKIEAWLANVAVGVETWINLAAVKNFERQLNSKSFLGHWRPEPKDCRLFLRAWDQVKAMIGMEPSNTGYVLRQAFMNFTGEVHLPHSEHAVPITPEISKFYIFKLARA
jgi:hypothetical protein